MSIIDPKDTLQTPGESPKPSRPHDPLQVTPSDTTVTLPTPDQAHTQLACHSQPRFIFYPISWDGSEDVPQSRKTMARSDILTDYVDDGKLHSPSAVCCSTDAFWSIDRWRRDVVKCGGGTAGLLDPIQDADTPMPLLSLPYDHRGGVFGGTQPYHTDSYGSEHDSVQLWIHP